MIFILKNVFTLMGVTDPLHVEVCSALQMKCSTIYIYICNVSTLIVRTMLVCEQSLLSCISKDPVLCACEERHDLIWLFSFLHIWSACLHLFSNSKDVNGDYTDTTI
jgi:hypothetical protein